MKLSNYNWINRLYTARYLLWCSTKKIEAVVVAFRIINLANPRPLQKVSSDGCSRDSTTLIKLDLNKFSKTAASLIQGELETNCLEYLKHQGSCVCQKNKFFYKENLINGNLFIYCHQHQIDFLIAYQGIEGTQCDRTEDKIISVYHTNMGMKHKDSFIATKYKKITWSCYS